MVKRLLSIILILIFVSQYAYAEVNPDTTDWFPYTIPDRTVMKGTALDASRLLDAPAGKHGFIKAVGDKLFFEDGTPVNFWGTNIVGHSVFLAKVRLDELVDIVTTSGYNMVRLHHLDSTSFAPNIYGSEPLSRVELDPDQLDKLHYLWARLRENGVYMFLDFMGIRHLSYEDAIGLGYSEEKAEVLQKAPWAFTAIKYFDKDLQDIQKVYMRQLLTTVNPYTGMTLAEDPAFAACCIANEDSLFCDDFFSPSIYYSSYFKNEVCSQFAEWLGGKYSSDAELGAAWYEEGKNGKSSEDSIENGYVYLDNYYYAEDRNLSSAKIRDIREFFRFKQSEYYENMKRYMNEELGVRAMISGSNTFWTADSTTELLTYVDSDMDISDQHAYYSSNVKGANHYVSDNNPLGQNAFTPMLTVGSTDNNIITNCARRRLYDLPCFQSEWAGTIPNLYLADANYQMAAYGALHGWNPLQYNLLQERYIPSSHALAQYYQTINNPAYITTMTAAAHMIIDNHVAESTGGYYAQVSDEEAIEYQFAPEYPEGIEFVTKTGIAFSDKLTEAELEKIAEENEKYEDAAKGHTYNSDTGELGMNPTEGVFTVNTDKTKLLAGLAGGREYLLGDTSLKFDNEYATLCVTSLTEDKVSESESILITVAAQCRNTGMLFDEENYVITEGGSAPILMEPVTGTVKIKTDNFYDVYTLTSSGERNEKLDAVKKDGCLIINLEKDHKTNHYELVKAEEPAGELTVNAEIDYVNNSLTLDGSCGVKYGDILAECTDKYTNQVYLGKTSLNEDGTYKITFAINGQSNNEYTVSLKHEGEPYYKTAVVKATAPSEKYRMQNIRILVDKNQAAAEGEIASTASITAAQLIIAAYDENGRLSDVSRLSKKLYYGSNTFKLSTKYVPLGHYKVMVWDEQLMPLTDLYLY